MATPPKSELAGTDTLDRQNTSKKLEQLEQFRSDATGQALRTNHGVKIADNQNSLRAGTRGPFPARRFHHAGEDHPLRP
ncbi:hypothetical protein Q3H58_003294 [Pseudomonas psychrotolerans]|nr:hypothetical protein [Pseudomonas psychrotolerans]